MTAIDDKHAELLDSGTLDLGPAVGDEVDLGDGGSMREYQFGTIYQHPELGAFEVHGAIIGTYINELGGPTGRLGYPTSDEFGSDQLRLNTFERGDSALLFDSTSGTTLIDDLPLRSFEDSLDPAILGDGVPIAAGPVQRLCFPPGVVAGDQRGSGFGLLAERLIHDDYCQVMGGCSPTTDYFDRTGSVVEYLVFLQSHNPGLRPTYREIRRWKRPDILTSSPTRREWYEVKPLSVSGIIDFLEKLSNIPSYMARNGLAYIPGVAYTPTPFIPLGTFTILGIDIEASLGVARRTPGLIDYQLCIRGNLVELLARIVLAALVAAILAQILARFAVLLAV